MLNIYQLEQRIQQLMESRRVVGVALAIIQNAEVTYARGFGVTSVEDGGLPVTPHTLFCIGSISKTLTVTLVRINPVVTVADYPPPERWQSPPATRRWPA